MREPREIVHSIHESASSISRWAMHMALFQRVSPDRLTDIKYSAERILEQVKELENVRAFSPPRSQS